MAPKPRFAGWSLQSPNFNSKQPIKIRRIERVEKVSGETIPKLLLKIASEQGEKVAIREKKRGIWQPYSWSEYLENVRKFALGLASLGLQRGDRLSVIGDNSPQGYWAQVATLCVGGVSVPLYQDAIEKELEYVIEHSGARFIFAEDQEQVDKILALKEKIPTIETIIYVDPTGLGYYNQPYIKSFFRIQELGLEFEKNHPGHFQKEVENGRPEDVALISYTSGTTAKPKGVVLTHENLLINAKLLSQVEGYRDSDRFMSYLPMAWIGDFLYSVILSFQVGFTVNCPEAAWTTWGDTRQIGPTVVLSLPRIWESILTSIQLKMQDSAWIKRRMYKLFIDVAVRVSNLQLEHQAVPIWLRTLHAIGEFLVYGPLRDYMGMGKILYAYSVGAALGPEIYQYYRAIGVNLKQVYGLTETSAICTFQPDDEVKLNTVGIPFSGVEIKISEEGEVLVKSPGNFHGYYKNPQATAETLIDEWLHTGDSGILDKDGHLKIIDRVQDVSTLANGTTFAPQYIENKLKFSPYIKESVVFGQGMDHVTSMINIDIESVGNWAERKGIGYTSYPDLSQKPQVYDLIYDEVRKVNVSLFAEEDLRDAQIRRYLILHKELDPDDAEITQMRKLRRGFIAQKYSDLIEGLYSDGDGVYLETEVTYEGGRTKNIKALLKIRDVDTYTVGDDEKAASLKAKGNEHTRTQLI